MDHQRRQPMNAFHRYSGEKRLPGSVWDLYGTKEGQPLGSRPVRATVVVVAQGATCLPAPLQPLLLHMKGRCCRCRCRRIRALAVREELERPPSDMPPNRRAAALPLLHQLVAHEVNQRPVASTLQQQLAGSVNDVLNCNSPF
jgi:hypothetical protein